MLYMEYRWIVRMTLLKGAIELPSNICVLELNVMNVDCWTN